MRLARETFAALNQTTTGGAAARQRLIDAIKNVEETVQRLVQASQETYAAERALPREQAQAAAERLSAFVARRLTQPSTDGKHKIVVVLSRGGTCRDPMAKAILDQLLDRVRPRPEVTVIAAGLGPLTSMAATPAARHAIERLLGEDVLAHHVPALLTAELARDAHVILAMDSGLVGKTLPKEKTYLFTEFLGDHGDIADPYREGQDDADAATIARYTACAEHLRALLVRRLDRLLDTLSI
jgi:protein-tyrosine-phosphatase